MVKWQLKKCSIWVSSHLIQIFAYSETTATYQVDFNFSNFKIKFGANTNINLIVGMDFAHVFNGYRYHTKYDHIDYIPTEVLQRTGDNVLALVKRMANSDELTNTDV